MTESTAPAPTSATPEPHEVHIRLAAIRQWAEHAADGRVTALEALRAMAGLAEAAQRFVGAEAEQAA